MKTLIANWHKKYDRAEEPFRFLSFIVCVMVALIMINSSFIPLAIVGLLWLLFLGYSRIWYLTGGAKYATVKKKNELVGKLSWP